MSDFDKIVENVKHRVNEDASKFRFRASIYLDVYVVGNSLEEARADAKNRVQQVVNVIADNESGNIPDGVYSPYVGGVAKLSPDLSMPLDAEI